MEHAAVIYDSFNTIVKVEERLTADRAQRAGEFFTRGRSGWWFKVVTTAEVVEMYKAMINA